MRSLRLVPAVILALMLGAVLPTASAAEDNLAQLLLQFFSPSNPVVLQQAPAPFDHSAHFASQPNAQALLTQLNSGIASQISTFPLGSSSRVSPTHSILRWEFSIGARRPSVRSHDLGKGEMQLYLTHLDTNADRSNLAPWFEGDIIRAGLSMNLAPRAVVGYTLSNGGGEFTGDLPDEVNYSAGFDAGLHRRVTLTADVMGRTLLDANRLANQDVTFRFATRTDPTVRTATRSTPFSSTGNLNLLLGSAGLKINPAGHLLLVGNVLFSLSDDGLQDKITPVFGIDYSF